MGERPIDLLIEQRLKMGEDRQSIFEDLSQQLPAKEVVDILRYNPSRKTKSRYRMHNILLFVLLVAIVVIRVVEVFVFKTRTDSISMAMPLVCAGLAYGTAIFYAHIYRAIGIVFLMTIFLGEFPGVFRPPLEALHVTLFGLTVTTGILAFWLHAKIAGKPATQRVYFTDVNGQQRGKDVPFFRD